MLVVALGIRLGGVVVETCTLSGKAALMRDRVFGVRGPAEEAEVTFVSSAVFLVYFLVAVGVGVSAGKVVALDMALFLVALGVVGDG